MSLPRRRPRRQRRARRRSSAWTARSARCGPARSPTSRSSACCQGSFPLYDIWGEMREASRAAREHADDRRRPAARAAAAARARAVGASTRSGRRRRRRSPSAAGVRATAGTRRPRCARGRGRVEDDYWTRPRAATGQRPATRPPSTTVTSDARLIAGQTWFGTIATPVADAHLGVRRHADDAVLLAQADDVPVVVPPAPRRRRRRVGRRASGPR